MSTPVMRLARGVAALAFLGGAVVATQPSPATAATTTATTLRTRAIEVNGYRMTLTARRVTGATSTQMSIEFVRNLEVDGTSEEQRHSYAFVVPGGLTVSRDLKRGTLKSRESLGDFGSVSLNFRRVGQLRRSPSCGVINRTRTLVLRGRFSFAPDRPGVNYFGPISRSSLRAKVIRGGQGECEPPVEQTCAPGTFLNAITADIAVGAGALPGETARTFDILGFEDRAPADTIVHEATIRTEAPDTFTWTEDLMHAGIAAPAGVSVSGTASFNARETGSDRVDCGSQQRDARMAGGVIQGDFTVDLGPFGLHSLIEEAPAGLIDIQ